MLGLLADYKPMLRQADHMPDLMVAMRKLDLQLASRMPRLAQQAFRSHSFEAVRNSLVAGHIQLAVNHSRHTWAASQAEAVDTSSQVLEPKPSELVLAMLAVAMVMTRQSEP